MLHHAPSDKKTDLTHGQFLCFDLTGSLFYYTRYVDNLILGIPDGVGGTTTEALMTMIKVHGDLTSDIY
jgi:hypothetical protein